MSGAPDGALTAVSVFIELTDHLRCTAEHPESFLVLVPDAMDGRLVVRGTLGCPVCHAEYPIVEGVVRFDRVRPPEAGQSLGVDPAALHAFLGIEGPGGFIALIGRAAGHAEALAPLLPGVHIVAVNPPDGVLPTPRLSVLEAPRLPIKQRSLRGIVLGRPEAIEPAWQADAIHSILPGLRAVGEGPIPTEPAFELLGSAEGWWVGRVKG
ncbi:MAG TPA: hypothetical protein VEI47_01870 [Gemmatimonadales bacterium]|nr:hypothetical protein [Gemmatimonadales bacterium]